jgi:hypothetical protein
MKKLALVLPLIVSLAALLSACDELDPVGIVVYVDGERVEDGDGYNFGYVLRNEEGSSNAKTVAVTVRDNGSADLTVEKAEIEPEDNDMFTLDASQLLKEIDAQTESSCSLVFDPFSVGEQSCDLVIRNNSKTPEYRITLSGTVVDREVVNLRAASANNSITLTWEDPKFSGFRQVRVVLSGVADALVDKGVQTYTLSGLTNNVSYDITLSTIDAKAVQSAGKTVSGSPRDPNVATLADVLDASATVVLPSTIQLSWTEPSGADFDTVEISNSSGTVGVVYKGTTTYSVTGLAAGDYSFTIRTAKGSTKSPGVIVGGTIPDTTPPAEVSSLAASTPGAGQVRLTWNDPGDADFESVRVKYLIPWKGYFVIVNNDVAKGVKSFTATGLTAGYTYTFTVKTKDSAGNFSAGRTIDKAPY